MLWQKKPESCRCHGKKHQARQHSERASSSFPDQPSSTVHDEIDRLEPWLATREVHADSWVTSAEIQQINWNLAARMDWPVGLSSVDRVAKRLLHLAEGDVAARWKLYEHMSHQEVKQ